MTIILIKFFTPYIVALLALCIICDCIKNMSFSTFLAYIIGHRELTPTVKQEIIERLK